MPLPATRGNLGAELAAARGVSGTRAPEEATARTADADEMNIGRRHLVAAAGGLLLAAVLLAAARAQGAGDVVPARAHTLTTRLHAYAQVEPIALLAVRAARAGVVTDLDVVPGDTVKADAALARLAGPSFDAELAARKGALAGAQATANAARKSLAVVRQNFAAHVDTRDQLYQAQANVAQAQAAVKTAEAKLDAMRSAARVRAPVAGSVLAVHTSNGERVAQGQTLLTLQPARALWLRAVFYGVDARAVHPGMHGRFVPADGEPAIPVVVRTVIGSLRTDGGQAVSLAARHSEPTWRNGEAGTLILEGQHRSAVEVPTRALILYQGRWWVLVRDHHGEHRQAVVPGPSRGMWTAIEHGLTAGTDVVVTNAYLRFHRRVAQHYQPPD